MHASLPVDPRVKYKRIILKLSGELLRGEKSGDPIDEEALERTCKQIKEIHELGVQICVVIGGGNIFRGLTGERRGVDRAAARVRVRLMVDGAAIELVRPVHHRYADRAQGERVRPLMVAPAVAVNLPEPVALFPDTAARQVQVSVQANVANAQGDLRLEAPAGWKADPR